MAKKKILVLQDHLRSFCRLGWKCRVIGGTGGVVLVEAEVPDEPEAPEFDVSEEPKMELEG